MDYQELIERMRNSCEDAIQPDDVYEAADLIEQLQAENKRTAAERDELKNKNALLSAHVELYGEEARRLDDLSTDYARRIVHWVEKHNATKAERDAALAELAKYRDAPVVAYLYKYRNCFGDEVWTTDHNWGNRIPFESKPLIVKPDENK